VQAYYSSNFAPNDRPFRARTALALSAETQQHHPREVQRTPVHHNQGNFDSHSLQKGANEQPARHGAGADVHKMGFPDTKAPQADKQDRNFNPSTRMRGGQDAGPAKPPSEGGQGPERRANKPELPAKGKPEQPANGKPEQPGKDKDGFNDLPKAQTEKLGDGRTGTLVQDKTGQNYTGVVKDKQGNVRRIGTIENGKPQTTTDYSADGKPTSEKVDGNGTRKWDQDGKLLSDTRKDKSNQNTPEALKTTKNPDGTTTVTSGPGDGSHMQMKFGQDGKLQSQTKDANGTQTKDEFSPSGNLSSREVTHSTPDGKMYDNAKKTFDDKGNEKSDQYKDRWGNSTLDEKDENGKKTKSEASDPLHGYSKKETWDKDGGYKSQEQNGDTSKTFSSDGKGSWNSTTQRGNNYNRTESYDPKNGYSAVTKDGANTTKQTIPANGGQPTFELDPGAWRGY